KISADDSDQQGSKSPASENSQGLVGKVLTEPTHVVTETVDHVEKAVSGLDTSDKTDDDTSLNKGADTNRKPQNHPEKKQDSIGGVLGETIQTVSKTVDDVEEAVSGQDHSKNDKNSSKISADDSDQQGSKSPASENSQGLVGKVPTEPTHVVTETVDRVEKAVSGLDASDKTDDDTSLNKGADTNRKPQNRTPEKQFDHETALIRSEERNVGAATTIESNTY